MTQTLLFGDLVMGAYVEFGAWDLMLMIPLSKALKTSSPEDREKGKAGSPEIRLLFSSFQAGGL